MDKEQLVFVDLGSGKGRTLLLASEYPFRRIVGVELSPKLHRIAKTNVEKFRSEEQRCRTFALHCMDAVRYDAAARADVALHVSAVPDTGSRSRARTHRSQPARATSSVLRGLHEPDLRRARRRERIVPAREQRAAHDAWRIRLDDLSASLKERFPWISLGAFPTRVERITGLAPNGVELWVKHENESSDLFGGNKVRKLEFMLGHARARGCSRVRTFGGTGAHHVAATAHARTRERVHGRGRAVSSALRRARARAHRRGAEGGCAASLREEHPRRRAFPRALRQRHGVARGRRLVGGRHARLGRGRRRDPRADRSR